VYGAALMADGHLGYSQPVGGVVAYREHLSVSGAGFDLSCGNRASRTNLRADDIDVPRIMDEIAARISFGMGRPNAEPVDHPVLDKIANADFEPQRALAPLARSQLGTIGGGNHYVDLFSDEDGWLWVGVHFGSRGFGHKTASGFLAMAKGGKFTDKAPPEKQDGEPVLLREDSELGQAYLSAITLAGEYAYAGRDVVVEKVCHDILETWTVATVHNHHNHCYREVHDGNVVWVVRKGATPAWPGQRGFVGSTMGEDSVILEGLDTPAAKELLHSTVHGAGRVMSRNEAAGKMRWRLQCCNRDCDWIAPKGTQKPECCPKCGQVKMVKRPVSEGGGKIDWAAAKADLAARHIELRGAAADEAPGAYKRLDQVLAAHADSIRVVHTLRPLGVAMAGPDTMDPFRD